MVNGDFVARMLTRICSSYEKTVINLERRVEEWKRDAGTFQSEAAVLKAKLEASQKQVMELTKKKPCVCEKCGTKEMADNFWGSPKVLVGTEEQIQKGKQMLDDELLHQRLKDLGYQV